RLRFQQHTNAYSSCASYRRRVSIFGVRYSPQSEGPVARQSEIISWPRIGANETGDSAPTTCPVTFRNHFPWTDQRRCKRRSMCCRYLRASWRRFWILFFMVGSFHFPHDGSHHLSLLEVKRSHRKRHRGRGSRPLPTVVALLPGFRNSGGEHHRGRSRYWRHSRGA